MRAARALLVCVAMSATALQAQEVRPTVIPDAISCAACRVVLSDVVTLGTDDGSGAISTVPIDIDVDGRGRYWVVPFPDVGGGPIVFDAGGAVVRVVGGRGQGPGEFSRVGEAVPLPGDSVLILDGGTRRGTVIGPDLQPVRFFPVPQPLASNVVVHWRDQIVGMSHYAGGGRGGPVLHVMAFDSTPPRVTRSFGPEWSMRDINTMEKTVAKVSRAAVGVWSILPQTYGIDHYTRDGTLDARLERKPQWFASESMSIGTRDTPPGPRFGDLAEDAQGWLWTFVSVAAPTWWDAWPRDQGELRVVAFNREKMYRTTIEVIDPKAGRVIARRQLNDWIISTLPGDRAVIYMVNDDGFPRLRIVRYALEGR